MRTCEHCGSEIVQRDNEKPGRFAARRFCSVACSSKVNGLRGADATRRPLTEKFWSKVDKTSDCWLWTASTRNGYGQIARGDGRVDYAHRLSYEMAHGAIPPGLNIDHLCRQPLCVRPDHLEAVTQRENLRRGAGFGGDLYVPGSIQRRARKG
jgi:hypothetical protein